MPRKATVGSVRKVGFSEPAEALIGGGSLEEALREAGGIDLIASCRQITTTTERRAEVEIM